MKSLLYQFPLHSWLLLFFCMPLVAQSVYVVDAFAPGGSGGYSYANGQIGEVWGNWFGGALDSITWDSSSDASNDPNSGSIKIVASFNLNDYGQYVLFNGLTAFNLSALQYTNLQFDIRYAATSALRTNGNGSTDFGFMQVGTRTSDDQQDYFYGFAVPAKTPIGQANTNWIHISIPLSSVSDTNLLFIPDVLFHTINTYYGNTLNGTQTFWLDNIQFVGPSLVLTGACSVDWNNVHQRIDGFGASSAWDGSTWSSAEADLFFSTNTGCGLSLLRNRIAPDGTTVESSIMQAAQTRGAIAWSTPWSPPSIYKNTNSVNGGAFVSSPANYSGYAAQLAGYVVNMQTRYGITISGISLQNEPDVSTTYESCLWTSQQFHDFIPYLAAALASSNVASTRILLPEDEHWQWNLATNSMDDPATSNLVGVLAAHNYGTTAAPVTQFGTSCPKPVWETEHYFGTDDSITNGVALAEEIHSFMTVANANAYHYWWLEGSGNGSLVGNSWTTPAKRIFVMGNYSRFVRPDFYRIDVANATAGLVSAYKDPGSSAFAIVAVNDNPNDIYQTFNLTNFGATQITPWITSSQYSLTQLTSVVITNVAASGNLASFAYDLPADSVVTFVGSALQPPSFVPIGIQSVNAGINVVVTNSIIDPNQPAQTWVFSLLNGPTNSNINSANGVFSWRPQVNQAGSTNVVAVLTSASALPQLAATNQFQIVVNSLNPLPCLAAALSGTGLTRTVRGPAGPDYSVLSSTNPAVSNSWSILFFTNSPSLPFVWQTLNVPNYPQQFFKLQLGP